MKKNLFISALVLCFGVTAYSQNTFPGAGSVGIGTTTPNASAMLEMKSTSKGILISRMTLAQRNAIVSPATGLLLYQTNNNPGFYYYNGSAWKAVNNVNGLNNNIFLGQNAGATTTSSYNVAIGKAALTTNTSGNYLTAIGDSSLFGNTLGAFNVAIGSKALYANLTGNDNVAVGVQALQSNLGSNNTSVGNAALLSNTTGIENAAVGRSVLLSNTSGKGNSAMGYRSLLANLTGNYNTAIGVDALKNSTGTGNTALGTNSGITNTTGNYNTYIGYNATGDPTITKSVAIGYNANVTISNAIVLGDGTQKVGIGVSAPAYKLDVCGTIRSKEVRVETGWCDFVFDEDYELRPLEEVELFIKENKHLPDVTKGSVIETEGLEVGKVSSQMIRKIEELTLYVIELQKQVDTLKGDK